MAFKINKEEIIAEAKRRRQNAEKDYAAKAEVIAGGYKTSKAKSTNSTASKKTTDTAASNSNVCAQIDEIRNTLGIKKNAGTTTEKALAANNPAFVYLQKAGGTTGGIKKGSDALVKGTASSIKNPVQIAALGAGDYGASNSTRLDKVINAAVSGSASGYKKLAADLTSSTGNLSMGESARAAINGVSQQEAEAAKRERANNGWVGDLKQNLLTGADESAARAYAYEQQAKEGLGTFGQGVVDFGIAGLQFAGDAALNAIAPGTGLAAMAGRAYGSASQQAKEMGLSEGEQQLSGLKSAAIEVLTEKLFGSVSKVAYGKGIVKNENLVNSLVNRLAKTDKGRTALKVLVGANEEGLEEVLSDILNPVADRVLKLDDGKGDWSDLADDFDVQQMLEDYIIGGALGLMGAGANVMSGQYKAENARQRAYEDYQKQLVNAGLATEQGGAAQTTAEKYKGIVEQSTQRGKRNLSDKETKNLETLIHGTYAQEDTSAVSSRLAQLGTSASEQTVNAIVKAVNGETLTKTEQKAFNANPYSQRVVNEMTDTRGVTSNEWYTDRAQGQSYTPEKSSGISTEQTQNALNGTEATENTVSENLAKRFGISQSEVERTYALNKSASPQAFETAFSAMYQMGRNGASRAMIGDIPALTKQQADTAYQMGAASRYFKNEGANNNEIHLRNVAERTGGQNTGGQVRGVAEGAGSNATGTGGSGQSGYSAVQGKAGEQVVYNGVAQKNAYYYTGEETEDMKKGRKLAESYGYKVVYFVGDNIRVQGGTVRGVVDTENKTVMVRADHPDLTPLQIMRHEMGHAAIAKGDFTLAELRQRLLKDFTDAEIDEMVEVYRSAYSGILDAGEAFEEICCDALGKINIFAGTKQNSASYVKAQRNIRKYAAEKNGSKGRAPPETGGVKYSLEGKNKDGVEVYTTSEDVRSLTRKERQKKFLEIMQNEYRGRTAKFVRNGHAYYATFDSRDVNKNIYGDRRSSNSGYNAKLKVGADGNIFELVENSKYDSSKVEQGKDTQSHKQVRYWDYFVKTVQIDNEVFDLLANVRRKSDGDYVYSIQLRANKSIEASAAQQPNQKVGVNKAANASENSIRSSEENVKKYSLEPVKAIQPQSSEWERGSTTDEVRAKHPDLWAVDAESSESRNPTQISGTVKSYRKIYDTLKAEGFDGTVLDASSGLGYGTRAGIEEYGFNVEDIEPFPDSSYKPKYTDYSKLHKKYDVIISNAVLNVLPQDQRDALVVKMGQMLNNGGRMFINVRGTDVRNASSKVAIDEGNMEYYISNTGSYQKGFTKKELVAYLQDALGDGYTVTGTNKFGAVSAVVTKKNTAKTAEKFSMEAEEDTEWQAKVNSAMTMDEAKRMLESTFKVCGIGRFGEYQNAEEWLREAGSEEVELNIDSEYSLYKKYIGGNEDILNEEYSIADVLDAYLEGTLVGKEKPKAKRMDTSKSYGLSDDRFYAPKKVEDAKALLDTANQKLTNANRATVNNARAKVLLFAHNKGAAELLGMTQAELNKKLRGWSAYSARAKSISEAANKGVAEENRWTGIENCSYINKTVVTDEEIERLVGDIKGSPNNYEKRYIARVMLAADTHISYKGLNFVFESKRDVNARFGNPNGSTNGFYSPGNAEVPDTIVCSYDKPETVAHEMGHYIDTRWGRDLIGADRGALFLTRGVNEEMIRARHGEDGIQFVKNFNIFMNSLMDVNTAISSYTNDPAEVFARFFAKFVEWTDNIATGSKTYSYESNMYGDKFTMSQYVEFIKLLQEKSMLDAKYEASQGKEKFSMETPVEQNYKAAVEYFGTTYKVKEAGYICTDGKMLDFSGRHEGAPGGYRTVDHRDITDALGEDYGGDNYSGGMIRFMSEGNIRVSPESGGINLSVAPNKAQRSTLDRYISSFRGEVVLDIDNANGDTVASIEYPKYTHSSVVLKDIDDYFDKGKVPEPFESGVKYSRETTSSIKQQIKNASDKLNTMDIVAKVKAPDLSKMSIKQQRQWAESFLKNTGYAVDRNGFGKIEFTPKHINEGLNYVKSPSEIAAFAALPKVLKRGVEIDSHTEHKGRQRDSVTIAAPVEINGVRGNMAVVVTITSKNHYHAHRIVLPNGGEFTFNIKEVDPKPAEAAPNAESSPIESTSKASVPDNSGKVKTSREPETLNELRRQNKVLRERVDYWKRQTKPTKVKQLRMDDIRRLAKEVVSMSETDLKPKDITEDLTELGKYLLNEPELRYTDVSEMAEDIAADVIENATAIVNEEDTAVHNELRDYLKRVKLRDDGSAEFESIRSSYKRRIMFDKNGLGVDTAYAELHDMFGEGYFPEDIVNPADQLERIGEVLDNTAPKYANPNGYYAKEATEFLRNYIIDSMLGEDMRQAAPTYADKAEAKLAAAKAQSAQKLNEQKTEYDEKISNIKAQNKKRIKKAIAEERQRGEKRLQRFRDSVESRDAKRKETAEKNRYKAQIEKNVKTLSDWLLKPDHKNALKHIPGELQSTVRDFIASIDFTSARQLGGGAATAKDMRYLSNLERLHRYITDKNVGEDRYSGYLDLPPNFETELGNFIHEVNALARKNSGYTINDMTVEQLKELSDIVKTMKKTITDMNRMYQNRTFQHAYDAGASDVATLKGYVRTKAFTTNLAANRLDQTVMWEQSRPAHVFRRFGKGGESIYREFADAQSTMAFLTKEVLDFANDAYKSSEVKAWAKETHTFEFGDDTVTLTTAQLMSLYELNKRKQAKQHLDAGGFRVANFKNGRFKLETDKKSHAFTDVELGKMFEKLTDRQKEVADKLQRFMVEKGGEWGNYVSIKRFDVEMFKDENYFPIKVDNGQLDAKETESVDNASLYQLLNMGFAKDVSAKANQALVVYDIFDVFANHMSEMAQYRSFALPVLDAMKWFNYKERNESGVVTASFREEMRRAFGSDVNGRGFAEKFITGVIKAYNGAEGRGENTYASKSLNLMNRQAVAYNTRVMIQQPSAIVRAAMFLDPTDLAASLKNYAGITTKTNIEEMHKYSGVAVWKDLGFYDVNVSRGVRELIKNDQGTISRINEIGMKGAELADKVTWAALWDASKKKVRRETGLNENSEEFYAKVSELFEDVIYNTQVVDTVLTKSEYSRDKRFSRRLFSSFMSEPMTTASLVTSEIFDIQMKQAAGEKLKLSDYSRLSKTCIVVAVAAAVNSALAALADAWRDDDDYGKFGDKWLRAFRIKLADELMPLTYLPYSSTVWDTFKLMLDKMEKKWFGLDVYGNGTDLPISDIIEATTKVVEIFKEIDEKGESSKYTKFGGYYKVVNVISKLTGVPIYNLMREIVTLNNNLRPDSKWKSYEPSAENSVYYAWKDGYLSNDEALDALQDMGDDSLDADKAYLTLEKWKANASSEYFAVYDAIDNDGDIRSAVKDMLDHGKEEGYVKSAITNHYKDAYINGDNAERARIRKALYATGLYGSVNDVIEKCNSWLK